VDASGTVTTPGGAKLSFRNAVELAGALGTSEEVRRCYARTVFRYVVGRRETDADAVALDGVTQRFLKSDGNVRDLWLAIAQSPSFLYRPLSPGEAQ